MTDTNSFRLTTQYMRATKLLTPLIDLASDDLIDSRKIARALHAYSDHKDDKKLARVLSYLRAKYGLDSAYKMVG